MAFRIGRTLPPAAAPMTAGDILFGLRGLVRGNNVVEELEADLKGYYNMRHCFAVSSGRAAIVLTLQAMHELRPERDEVLIPAYTCYSVPAAVKRAGLKVRLCDLAAGRLDLDHRLLEEQICNPRLLCVVPTHLFGLPADVERVTRLARRHGVFVLEDAAQAMGGGCNGRMLGAQGDAGIFSMARGKAFTTVGGGIILTDDDALGETLQAKVEFLPGCPASGCLEFIAGAIALTVLIKPWLYWLPKSLPFLNLGVTRFDTSFAVRKLSPFQAGIGMGWRRKIQQLKASRLANVKMLVEGGLRYPDAVSQATPDLIRFPVRVRDAEAKRTILAISEQSGLGISDGYPDSIDGIDGLDNLVGAKAFPQARKVAKTLLSLPVHSLVNLRDLSRVVDVMAPFTEVGQSEL